jgi:hypothetical protein
MTFDILVTGRTVGAFPAKSAGYHIRGVIENDQANTTFIGAPIVTVLGEDDMLWDATVVADNANDALAIKVTGVASTLVRWVAVVRTAEVAE